MHPKSEYLTIKFKELMHTLKCEFCGKTFKDDDFESYVKCVNACVNRKRKQVEADKQEMLKKERQASWSEVVKATKTAHDKLNAYVEKYGTAHINDADTDWLKSPLSFLFYTRE